MDRREYLLQQIRERRPLVANGNTVRPANEESNGNTGVPVKPHRWGRLSN